MDELFVTEAPAGAPPEVVAMIPDEALDTPLSGFPWREGDASDAVYIGPGEEGIAFLWQKKGVPGLDGCELLMVRMDRFNDLTVGRGSSKGEWMVDLELRAVGSRRETPFVLHAERPMPDRGSAMAYAKRLRDFVDRSTLRDLLAVPRSGRLSMSKIPV
jgi:hypothetical protein